MCNGPFQSLWPCGVDWVIWNVTIRNVFSLLWKSHRYWIEIVSNCLHPKTLLTSRFITFDKSLMSCRKSEVRFLASLCAEDHRTVVGKTLSRIASETSTSANLLTPTVVKNSLRYFDCPLEETRQISLMQELLELRRSKLKYEARRHGWYDQLPLHGLMAYTTKQIILISFKLFHYCEVTPPKQCCSKISVPWDC